MVVLTSNCNFWIVPLLHSVTEMFSLVPNLQGDSREKVIILGGESIGHCEQKGS